MKTKILVICFLASISLMLKGQDLYSFSEQNIFFEGTQITVMGSHH